MSELIHEAVITTVSPAGQVHVAPMGIRYTSASELVLMPFRPSTTLTNIETTGRAVLNLITDVRVFAGCVTGRQKQWPTLALPFLVGDGQLSAATSPSTEPATADQRLINTLGHEQLRLVHHDHDAKRPRLTLNRAATAQHAPFPGMNRAQAAVLEGAVLVSRLFMLPREKLEAEWRYLEIAIAKTAGPLELEAWAWLDQALHDHLLSLDTQEAAR